MVAFARIIMLASAVAAATTQLLPRDVVTVVNDITTKIGPQIATLNNHIAAFPASGATGAVEIVQDAEALLETVKIATRHVQDTGSFGIVAGTQILAQLQLQIPQLLATLVNIQLKASSWDAIEGPRLALEDLEAGNLAFSNYLDAIIAAEPLLQKAGGLAIKTQITRAFATTIRAFSYS